MQTNGAMNHRHQNNSIYEKSTVNYVIPHLTLHGMVKILAYMNLEYLDVIYTPPHHLISIYVTEHKKDNSWVTKKSEIQWNSGTHKSRNSDIVHLQDFMNITINLAKYGHQVLKLCLAQIFTPLQY